MLISRVRPNYDREKESYYYEKLSNLVNLNVADKLIVNSYLIECGDEVDSIVNIDLTYKNKNFHTSVHSLENATEWLINILNNS